MRRSRVQLSRFGFALLAAVLLMAGCGPAGPKLAPVSGKVLLDGAPLKGGSVNLVADTSKGNKQVGTSSGSIGADGTYRISTDGQDGAPPGWYKVVVVTVVPGMQSGNTGPMDPKARPPVPPQYSDSSKTGLSFEVTDSPKPGAYDLTLTK